MSAEFSTEYHRNYCRPHEVPAVTVRCGSPSSKLALTSEPCFKQKRKEPGHEARRTYTTDYVQYEDVNDLEEKDVPGDEAMRYKAGYRRVQFYPVSQYRMNYGWKLGEAPLELAAKRWTVRHRDEKEHVETEEGLPDASRNRNPVPPARSSSLEDLHQQVNSHRSPSPTLRRREGGRSPSHYRSSSTNGPQTSLASRNRSRSPDSHHAKPSSHHHHDHHHHGHHHHGHHHHGHHHHGHHHPTTDASSYDPHPVLSSKEVTKEDRTDYLSKASKVVHERKRGLCSEENRFAHHQPREHKRRERKRFGGSDMRHRMGKENREESSKKKTAKNDAGPDTTSLDEERNFYRRYQRSTAFPSPPRHRSSSHWTTEYVANYGSPLKASYVNGVWRGAYSPERHLEDGVGEKKLQPQPLTLAPPQVEEESVVLQYSAPCNWFDQVIELREKAEDYKERTRGNYFSREKLKELELAQRELQQRASSSALVSSSCSSSSPLCSRSSTPEPGDRAAVVDDLETRGRLSPGRATTKLRDNFTDLRVEDVESSEDPPAAQRREERRTVRTSGRSQPPDQSVQPASSSSPPAVSRLLRAPPVRPKASPGRVSTPELAQQQAADPSVTHRHHLDRTTPTKGNLLATIPHSLHLMGGSWRPPLGGKLTTAANSRNAAPLPGKSQPTRVKSARRAIFRDDHASQPGLQHPPPPPARSQGGLSGKWPQNVRSGMASELTSSHPPTRSNTARPRQTTASEMVVSQPVPPSTMSSHYPPSQPSLTSRLAPWTTHTSAQPSSSIDMTTQHRSTQPHPRTLTTDPTHRSIAARPLSCCTRSTCGTCGASLRAPSQAAPVHGHGTHFSRATDGSSRHAARVDVPRGGVSSTPTARDPGNGMSSVHPLPIHEQNHALSLSSLSISSSCSVASDILERARHRRDHFWS